MTITIGSYENGIGQRIDIIFHDKEDGFFYGKRYNPDGTRVSKLTEIYCVNGTKKDCTNQADWALVKPWVDKPKTKKGWVNLYLIDGVVRTYKSSYIDTSQSFPAYRSKEDAFRGKTERSGWFYLDTIEIEVPEDTYTY